MRLDPQVVRQQIANLLLAVPELEEDEILRADMIQAETDAHDVIKQANAIRRDAASFAGALATDIATMELRQARFERREKAMRDLIFKIMDAAGLSKLELPEATFSIRKGQRKLVGDPDPAALPDTLCRIKREPDRTAIKAALESGATVPGCELSNGEPSLSIRTK